MHPGNLKVAYANSKHRQFSAPKDTPPEHLSDIVRMEELLCERAPQLVNDFLLRQGWASGYLLGCAAEGSAAFSFHRVPGDIPLQGLKTLVEKRGFSRPCVHLFGDIPGIGRYM